MVHGANANVGVEDLVFVIGPAELRHIIYDLANRFWCDFGQVSVWCNMRVSLEIVPIGVVRVYAFGFKLERFGGCSKW